MSSLLPLHTRGGGGAYDLEGISQVVRLQRRGELTLQCSHPVHVMIPEFVTCMFGVCVDSPPLASVSSVLRRKPRYPVRAHTVCVSPKLSLELKWSDCSASSPYTVKYPLALWPLCTQIYARSTSAVTPCDHSYQSLISGPSSVKRTQTVDGFQKHDMF